MSDKKTRLEWTERDGCWYAKAGDIDLLIVTHDHQYHAYVNKKLATTVRSIERAKEVAENNLKAECEKWAEAARALGMPLSTAPQPIDTAPTDGTPILVDASQGGWIEAYWDKAKGDWESEHHCDWFSALAPKRWMPKPQDEEAQS